MNINNKFKIILVILVAISALFLGGTKYNGLVQQLSEAENTQITLKDSLVEMQLWNEQLTEDLCEALSKPPDSIILIDTNIVIVNEKDTLIKYDTVIIRPDSVFIDRELLDVIIPQYIDQHKPTWGTIYFCDSSNQFTTIRVLTRWPHGGSDITYMNKYKIKRFDKNIGIGYGDKEIYISADVFYNNVGLGLTAGMNGAQQLYFKYKF